MCIVPYSVLVGAVRASWPSCWPPLHTQKCIHEQNDRNHLNKMNAMDATNADNGICLGASASTVTKCIRVPAQLSQQLTQS